LPPSNWPISSSETCKNEREACACMYLYYCVSSTSLLTRWLAGVPEEIITITQRTRAHRQARDAMVLCVGRACVRTPCCCVGDGVVAVVVFLTYPTVHSASVRRSLLSAVVLSISDIAHPFEFRCPFSVPNVVGCAKPTPTIDRHSSLSLVSPDRLSPLLLSSHRVTGWKSVNRARTVHRVLARFPVRRTVNEQFFLLSCHHVHHPEVPAGGIAWR